MYLTCKYALCKIQTKKLQISSSQSITHSKNKQTIKQKNPNRFHHTTWIARKRLEGKAIADNQF